jgi:hypothetical protein
MVAVTGSIQDLISSGVAPSRGSVEVSLVLPDIDDPITTRAPFTAQAVDGDFSFDVPASGEGNGYRFRCIGVPGLRNFYFHVPDVEGVTLAELIESHQVDPTSFEPVTTAPTVRGELDDLDTRVTALEEGGGGGGGAVASVNAKTGVVVLTQDDVASGTTAKQYTATEKTKLAGIAAGAEVNVNPDWTAVSGDGQILNKPTLGTAAASASTDFATAAQGTKADSAVQPAALTGYVPTTRTVGGHTLDADVSLVKGDVGLGNVDNTADTAKPVSTAQATAIALKYTKPGTGIPSTDMTTAVQTSLGKADSALQSAPVASVAGKTGVVTLVASDVGAVPTTRTVNGKALSADITLAQSDVSGTVPTTRTVAGLDLSADRTASAVKTALTLVKADVGLGNVDNTADTAKPVSTAQQTALDGKLATTAFLNGLTAVWIGTQAQYAALGSYTSTVLYAITP